MFRITGADLPQEKLGKRKAIPGFRIWQTPGRGMGAIARINRTKTLSNDSAIVETIPEPEWISIYRVIDFGYEICNVSIPGFKKIDNPNLSPQDPCIQVITKNSFWFEGTKLNLIYDSEPILETALVILNQIINTTALNEVEIVSGFSVLEICSAGLSFQPTSENNPQAGQFFQDANLLNIETSPQYNLNPGDEVSLIGQFSLLYLNSKVIETIAIAFEVTNIDKLDAIDWLGGTFLPAQNSYSPTQGEFIFLGNQAIIFTDKINLLPIVQEEQEIIVQF